MAVHAVHPAPVPCRECGTILQATYAEQNMFCCPGCGATVCYICGCSDDHPCVVEQSNGDGTSKTTWICSWIEHGGVVMCNHCFSRFTYELYMEATGRPADDPFYMSLGRSARVVYGLDHGV